MIETSSSPDSVPDDRDRFIPVRKVDILSALVDHGAIAGADERGKFIEICRMLAAIYHFEYFELLEKLRHAYFYFDPELGQHPDFEPAMLDQAYGELVDSLSSVLKGANFVEVSLEEIGHAHDESAVVQVALSTPMEEFREVRFFRRGHHHETVTVKRWYGLRKREVETEIYDDVILFVAIKSLAEFSSKRQRDRLLSRKIRPGSVIIKYFRNIAKADLTALYPNARVVMTTFDKLFLTIPAIAGAIPILLNLSSTLVVLFLVIGFYLGVSAAIEDSHLKTAFAALTGLFALGGFVARQWFKYKAKALQHQMEVTDKVYFRNINNNAGIFDTVIGSAEDQECKEAFLAYYFLITSPAPLTQEQLDQRIELWLLETFGIDLDFEVDDALGKLDRLGLLRRDGEKLSVPNPDKTLARLDYIWDNYFQYNNAEAEAERV
ncbi:MAG TPA: TMEM143 family protein [Xanthobacteraceae bacterium]|nr:TMEM143 family protein [Xanthobacteraceae bacterium]